MHLSLPEEFKFRVLKDDFLGKRLLDALETESPVSVRKNLKKINAPLPVLNEVQWCKDAFYLVERPVFTLDPLFHAGAYYPQEAGSMLLDYVLRSLKLPEDPVILDLCAAPGGKSTLIASFLNGKGLLVSNEIISQRASILRENLVKWGFENTIVTNNKPSDFQRLPHFFDVVVVDAPCSGEGMFRKDREARKEWTEASVILCADRQKAILTDIWDSLKPGGYLIYSTCTFNRLENEDNVKWLLETYDAESIPIQIPKTVIADREGLGVYSLPGIALTEGFYLAVLQKPDAQHQRIKFQFKLNAFKDKKTLLPWIREERVNIYQREEWIYALPQSMDREMLHVQAVMKLLKMGVTIGTVARKGLIPSEELALSTGLRSLDIPTVTVNREDALSYLRGDTFNIVGPEGWSLISYQGESLGWIKKIGNRFNNHYPKEWRIRMRIDL
jgi:16S rRNA C967 or C1407 C5-methylase (RsmB/RsmF family)/NOL1/NOP2/fmu family ribosome biogenesis protein